VADNRKKPAVNKPAAKKQGGGFSGAMITWIAVGVVVAVLATIVIIKTTSSPPSAGPGIGQYTSQTIVKQVTEIPLTVYNEIGVTSPIIAVYPPANQQGQKPLTYIQDGKKLPGGFYWGAEFCPYCAATRWGLIAALSRFGTFTGLTNMASSATDTDANTPTFSFLKATYSSQYLVFKFFEVENRSGQPLESTPAKETAIISKYNPKGDFPFIDFGNQFIQSTAFDPATLDGTLTRMEIAGSLSDSTIPSTQAIVASANYMSASICTLTKSAPTSVCHSSGVEAAAAAMHVTL
jgi:hypothetical protein